MSTVQDFRNKASENAFEEPEEVTLPSGLKPTLRRPKPIWWVLVKGTLPQSLAIQASGEAPVSADPEDVAAAIPAVVRLVESMFVSPKVKRGAAYDDPEFLNPNLIDDADLTFIIRYAGGEVAADGSNLETFRGRPATAAAGSGGGTVELSAESDSGADGHPGLAD